MNKVSFFIFVFYFSFYSLAGFGQDKVRFTQQDIVARAKSQSTAALRVEHIKQNRFCQYRRYSTDYNPQLRLNGTIPNYTQAVNNITKPDGSIEFREVKQNLVDLELGLQQVISPTGGIVSVNSSSSRFDN